MGKINRWSRLSRAPDDRSPVLSTRHAFVPCFVEKPTLYARSAKTGEGPRDVFFELYAASREPSEAVSARPAIHGGQNHHRSNRDWWVAVEGDKVVSPSLCVILLGVLTRYT